MVFILEVKLDQDYTNNIGIEKIVIASSLGYVLTSDKGKPPVI
jgi:hypothetical protein